MSTSSPTATSGIGQFLPWLQRVLGASAAIRAGTAPVAAGMPRAPSFMAAWPYSDYGAREQEQDRDPGADVRWPPHRL
jgi:hypothetical protein